jgi:hypothetical protein
VSSTWRQRLRALWSICHLPQQPVGKSRLTAPEHASGAP